jgi:hypothetical protein
MTCSRSSSSTLILLGLQELACLPPSEGELLQEAERPLLQGRPSFQVGMGESGDVLVAFRLDRLPTMQFLFDDELSSKLVRELSEIIATPRTIAINQIRIESCQNTLERPAHGRCVRSHGDGGHVD